MGGITYREGPQFGGVTYREGWTDIGGRMRAYMAENPDIERPPACTRRTNMNIRVAVDMAWVTFDEYAPESGDPAKDMPGRSREVRFLEKHDGEWKIAYSLYLYRSLENVVSALVRVDGRSKVEWLNAAARKILQEDCGLVVEDGILQAKDHASDERLQASIRWAAS